MNANLYTFVGMYGRGLATLGHILAKGGEFAQANGVAEADMLDWRLAEDMFPLRRQAQVVIDFSRQWTARAVDAIVPPALLGEPDLQELQAAIRTAKAELAALTPAQIEGRDEVQLTVDIGQMAPTFAIAQWIPGFATPNFYFHLSMAYAILRSRGVPLGKRDFFAGGI